MISNKKIITTEEIKIQEKELFELIKEYLKSKGVENTEKHIQIDFKKEVVEGYDRNYCDIVIKKYD